MKKLSKNKSKHAIKIKFKDNGSKNKKHKIKFTTAKPSKERVMVVAQELRFARLLAGNEKKSRDRVLKALKKWLNNCFVKGYEFKEDDFIRIWKGLFYAVWMSDKPLIQEELCENISSILDQFPEDHHQAAMMMAGAGFRVLATEWYGIDQHRIDKFLMLARRYLRAALRCVCRAGWALSSCTAFSEMLGGTEGIFAPKTPIYARNALSLLLHVADCFIEEVSKVSKGNIPPESLAELLRPFAIYMKSGSEIRAAVACRRVLTQLARQSKPAIEGEEKRAAWRQMGCPEGGPEALEKESDDESGDDNDGQNSEDDETNDGDLPLDPRAGRVDVQLQPLPAFEVAPIIQRMLEELLKTASGTARNRLKTCAERFKKITEDKYPFPERDLINVRPEDLRWDKNAAAQELSKFEKEVVKDPTKEVLSTLSRRKRKKLLAKARLGAGIAEELAELTNSAPAATGSWNVEESPVEKPMKKKRRAANQEEKQESSPPKKLKLAVKSPKSNKSKMKKQVNKENTHQNMQKATNKNITAKSSKEEKKPATEKTQKSPKVEKKLKATEKPAVPQKPKPEVLNTPKDKQKAYGKPDKVKLVIKTNSLKSPKSDEKVNLTLNTPKRVKFVLKNNSMQQPIDYYKSIRESPNIPFDGTKKPTKTNLKPNSTPSPINPFFKKKLRLK